MAQRMLKTAIVTAASAWLIFMAPLTVAHAGESALDACRKWTGQGAGMQYKCFDCMKQIGAWPNEHWVNTCADDHRYLGYDQGWFFFSY